MIKGIELGIIGLGLGLRFFDCALCFFFVVVFMLIKVFEEGNGKCDLFVYVGWVIFIRLGFK